METKRIYQALNQTASDYPSLPLHELIGRQCEQTPNSVAVLWESETQTYAELHNQSDRIAQFLCSQGVGPGDLVGLCCNRNLDMPTLLLGILKSGAGYVPLDPDYPVDRLVYMVEDADVKHILGHESQRHLLTQFGRTFTLVGVGCWDQVVAEPSASVSGKSSLDDVAYVIYTSGSTGKPKGVLVTHRNAVNFLWSMKQCPGFTAQDRILATTTLSFDISVLEIFLPLVVGGSVAIVDRQTAKDTDLLVASMERFDVTMMQATPAMWRLILESNFKGRSNLRFVTAGEPLPRDLIRPLLARCGEFWNLYGPTETTVYSTGAKVESDQGPILIGVPVANTQVFIVDEHNRLCPPGVPGELLIGGDGVTLGYRNRDELNAEKFVDYHGQRVYRTGDLAQLTEDGQIHHLGRIDNQIKFNGHRIELGEIDAAMASQPNVRQAATVLREDQPGDLRLVGYLLSRPDQQPDPVGVRESIAKTLPEYMVPSQIVVADHFYYTPSGKLDRKAFPPPSSSRPDLANEFVDPITELEVGLARIWSEVLQIDQVGTTDNFIDLGGNSIRAAKVVARAKAELDFDISSAQFFDRPTIAALVSAKHATPCANVSSGGQLKSWQDQEFAIIGMAARMPGAKNLREFWQNLLEQKESIRFFSPDELDPTLNPAETSSHNYCAARGIIDHADEFDARFFQVMPKAAQLIDPQQRIMLEISWWALEDAGIVVDPANRIGVWAGTYETNYFYKNVLTHQELVRETGEFQIGAYNEKDYIATRTAHALNLRGPAVNVNTACSTSLVTVIEACKSLALNQCDAAIAGAVSVHFPQHCGHLHQEGSIFSPDGHCRPFDAEAAGTLFCDGAGVVVVKRLEDALANGDRIYAVVKGCGLNNDGGGKASFSAPSIEGQAGAIAMAHQHAGISPETIGYIEAHGTATPVGDPIEIAALQSVFETGTDQKQFCAIGSVKSNIGHTVAAAGVAGLIKTTLALFHEKIPATLHYRKPNPRIDFESSPFFVCERNLPWQRTDNPRRAGVSAFGVGGTNAHVVLEEAPANLIEAGSDDSNAIPLRIFPVSAKTEQAVVESCHQLADFISTSTHVSMNEVAHTLTNRRAAFAHRAFTVAKTLEEAGEAFAVQKAPSLTKRKSSTHNRDVVFMFPGQGSQYVRMGQDLYRHNQVFRDSLDECCEILKPLLERDLRAVLFPPDADVEAAKTILKATQFTQPALFSLGYSLAKLWLSWGIQPQILIGHSIGEFAAACTAGVFSLEDGLKMIAKRGALMQALPGGSMMSVRLPGNEVQRLLWGQMAIGSYNGPQLCVVAGPDDEMAQLQEKLEDQDVVCRHLHTSHAFHSPMMDSIVAPFAEFVSQFELSSTSLPIMSTVTGEWMTDDQATDPNYWAEHLRKPVRFSGAVTNVWTEDPTRILIELGPRKTLATLAKQHASDPKNQHAFPTLSNNADDHAEWRATLSAVGQLWSCGVAVDWKRLFPGDTPIVSLPEYPFQRKRYFLEPQPVESQPNSTTVVDASNPEPNFKSPNENLKSRRKAMSRLPNIVRAIKDVFENTSGFDLDEFDAETTFFEMGLDSLVLTQTATSLKKEFSVDVTFRQLLESTPNVDTLAAFLDGELPADAYQPIEDAAAEPEPLVSAPVSEAPSTLQNSAPVTPANPVPNGTTPSAPANITFNAGGSAESIIQNQLQLMAAQLQLLGAQPAQLQQVCSTPATQSSCAVETPNSEVPTPDIKTEITNNERRAEAIEDLEPAKKAKRFSTVKLNDGSLSTDQQAALDQMIQLNSTMLAKSKAYAQQHRKYMADPRTVSGFRPNMKEMTHPIVVERSKGVQLWDLDGNEYIDFTCGFGSNLLGHTHDVTVKAITEQVQRDYAIGPQSPLAGEVARLFCEITGNERMAFSNTGSEAVLGCTRLARNATGRDLIVMFNGDYHGILDEVIARGSKKLKSFPAATGIPKDHVGNTLILEYGCNESLEIIRERMDEIAAVLVEPVQSRRPELQPRNFFRRCER